jgi:hypothetical protein
MAALYISAYNSYTRQDTYYYICIKVLAPNTFGLGLVL